MSNGNSVQAYPLRQLGLEEAIQHQFRLMDHVFRHFTGFEIVQGGDYGFSPELDRPLFTMKVEQTLAAFFDAPEAVLIRGGGTGGIRACLMAGLRAHQTLLLHDAPPYPTTEASLEFLGLRSVCADMNLLSSLRQAAREARPNGAIVQHTRNKIDDSYDPAEVIRAISEESPDTLILADDSYAAMRVPKIGVQLGADLSVFSLFKLLGPPGIGCVVGGSERGRDVIADIRRLHRSGGFRVQGPEAMDALRSLTLAPVALAVQARVVYELARRLNSGEVKGVRTAFVANTNSLCVFAELERPIAPQVLRIAPRLGAQQRNVGSESRFDISATFDEPFSYLPPTAFPWLLENRERIVRVNPYRTGPDTIIRILNEAIAQAERLPTAGPVPAAPPASGRRRPA